MTDVRKRPGDSSRGTVTESWGSTIEGDSSLRDPGKPLRLRTSLGIYHPSVRSRVSRAYCIWQLLKDLFGVWQEGSSAGTRAQASPRLRAAPYSLGRLFPTLPPPATGIRLGVAMETGEVT